VRLDSLSYRPATQAEFPSIRDLIHEVGINPMGLDWRHFIVAMDADGKLAGCGQVKLHRDGSRELASIAVAERYRGQGIARAIIERLLSENPAPLYLMCLSRLGPFYEKFDFHALAFDEMPRYFRRISRLAGVVGLLAHEGEHLLVMKRD
jgi:N-acetylglutamate synthase-like GNAT family acetyltransferase